MRKLFLILMLLISSVSNAQKYKYNISKSCTIDEYDSTYTNCGDVFLSKVVVNLKKKNGVIILNINGILFYHKIIKIIDDSDMTIFILDKGCEARLFNDKSVFILITPEEDDYPSTLFAFGKSN